jgi:hypothetical protein
MADGAPQPCRWCGAEHGPLCPHVRAYQFDSDMNVVGVEFWPPRPGETSEPDVDYPKLPTKPGD